MAVTIQEVDHIARLAKLSFSEDEKEKFVEQFNQILTYMEKLNELDTSDVEPTYNVLALTNVMRPDEEKTWLSQEEALANAPRSNHGFFSVPKVIG
ncbi:Asp-tRNA(Asn)/Glu-tRNA(Gln) amidotransferase subunit GatC [candidate division KSB1 bacterium]|nr:Asp-tRNA(Asn)/Glu-tRNA(Gln) amidotransferase subunit GatC [candidate division KSB1 bacterium]RQV99802.1 MAG: Asp-tRNA(Asn)/Glu-tRNA(Gln) amidotransferase subunit GatC [candidate division KSB1 bacterium]